MNTDVILVKTEILSKSSSLIMSVGTLFIYQKVFTQLTFTCSKSTIETLEKGVKYVQS